MQINFSKTERGFAEIKFQDRYDQECSLKKSSLASEDAVWLGVTTDLRGQPGRHMHLTTDQVSALLPILQHFAWTGELPDGSTSHGRLADVEKIRAAAVALTLAASALLDLDDEGEAEAQSDDWTSAVLELAAAIDEVNTVTQPQLLAEDGGFFRITTMETVRRTYLVEAESPAHAVRAFVEEGAGSVVEEIVEQSIRQGDAVPVEPTGEASPA